MPLSFSMIKEQYSIKVYAIAYSYGNKETSINAIGVDFNCKPDLSFVEPRSLIR